LLLRLVKDILDQSTRPGHLIVIDGDPANGKVRELLSEIQTGPNLRVSYLPSNHGNLAYQRYLGWRLAKGAEHLLYLDDDLRIADQKSIERVLQPFSWPGGGVVAVTARPSGTDPSKLTSQPALIERTQIRMDLFARLAKRWGSSRGVAPGGITPTGDRILSAGIEPYETVSWLYGRVMAFSMLALTSECFSDTLFAMDHHRMLLGEETFLGLRVRKRGKILIANAAEFLHPDDDLPQAYPTGARALGFTSAYSRRMVNDHYRGFEGPLPADRVALLKTYFGNILAVWGRAIIHPVRYRLAFAAGYSSGAIRGLLRSPTARSLTPQIDWWGNAEQALLKVIEI